MLRWRPALFSAGILILDDWWWIYKMRINDHTLLPQQLITPNNRKSCHKLHVPLATWSVQGCGRSKNEKCCRFCQGLIGLSHYSFGDGIEFLKSEILQFVVPDLVIIISENRFSSVTKPFTVVKNYSPLFPCARWALTVSASPSQSGLLLVFTSKAIISVFFHRLCG